MKIIQFTDFQGKRRVGIVIDEYTIKMLVGEQTVYNLAQKAIQQHRALSELLNDQPVARSIDYEALIAEKRLLPPLDHPDPAHMLISGTGLTHLGSADARDQMHKQNPENKTDSMKMFQMGLEGGKPPAGQRAHPSWRGVQPEWFYKGDGQWVVAPYQTIHSPAFALDHGEEPEIVGLYVIGPQGQPYRLGFALGNEFSDHVMERQNYLYLAHSKLRPSSFGPEARLGALPQDIRGNARILRQGTVIWEKAFLSGEQNMSHSIANLEYHHFKYPHFRHPGDVHIHFFGTATLSFAHGITLQPEDEIEIQAEVFGRPLRNRLAIADTAKPQVFALY